MKHQMKFFKKIPGHQQGAVLFIGLVLLLGVTLLSISGMQSVVLNERMATNAFEVERDNQLAESAGYYAIHQKNWVNDALTYLDNHSNFQLKIPPTDMHEVTTLTSVQENTNPVKVGLLARSFQAPGTSAGLGSGVDSWLVETYGNAGVENNGNTIIQGFKILGAGGND